ncbi:sensor histidine kinase [Streptomyces sp. H27-D2]|uniref:sensor histidine kinase n=1 Tax=Streptomyces sp. H27-D2 TaxID=3046304 RepID=UPI002DBCC711|nr:HAMP domain-containing sensor histidine kinase [Streptomyces sp. H27-D2]MEC4015144.1 HAMP domain-containing sensor histidine kinase [Streptomyces sp. H27-D2]
MGIRGRIALAISVVTALAVLVLGFAVHHIADADRARQARAYQDDRLSAALQIYDRDGTLALGARLDDTALPGVLDAALARDGSGTYISGGDDPRVWAATEVGRSALSVSVAFPEDDPAQRALDRALLIAGTSTVVLSAVVSWFVARRLSRRLRRAAAAARRIAGGASPDSQRRALDGGGRDEVAELGRAVLQMGASLAARVRVEREFTADVAHELRTPVAGLVAAAELLPHERAVVMVRDRAQVLRRLVEELLEVSRLDAGAESAELDPVELPALVRGIVTRAAPRAGEPGEAGEAGVTVTVVGEPRVVATDVRRVERVLVSLLANAAKHGRPPVEVRVEGTRVSVRDHGDGYPAELVAQGPRRFRSGAPARGTGHGLGLTIAVGQADVLGGRLAFGAAEDGGAESVLELPAAGSRPAP